MKTAIYILIENEIPIYVGKSKIPKQRKVQHRQTFSNADFEIIDEVDSCDWQFWEMFYVSLFKSWGFVLKNKNGGGTGRHTVNLEVRQKMSLRRHSPETRLKMSSGKKGKPSNMKSVKVSKETKQKIRKTLLGNTPWNKGTKGAYSKEHLKKLSDKRKL